MPIGIQDAKLIKDKYIIMSDEVIMLWCDLTQTLNTLLKSESISKDNDSNMTSTRLKLDRGTIKHSMMEGFNVKYTNNPDSVDIITVIHHTVTLMQLYNQYVKHILDYKKKGHSPLNIEHYLHKWFKVITDYEYALLQGAWIEQREGNIKSDNFSGFKNITDAYELLNHHETVTSRLLNIMQLVTDK